MIKAWAFIFEPAVACTAQTKDFLGVTGKITLDENRNARVPVYMLRIERGGKFTLQHQSIPTAAKIIQGAEA